MEARRAGCSLAWPAAGRWGGALPSSLRHASMEDDKEGKSYGIGTLESHDAVEAVPGALEPCGGDGVVAGRDGPPVQRVSWDHAVLGHSGVPVVSPGGRARAGSGIRARGGSPRYAARRYQY